MDAKSADDFIRPFITEQEIRVALKHHDLLTPKIEKALFWVAKIHGKQLRDSGAPYLEEHIYPLIRSVLGKYAHYEQLEKLILVLIMHDVLEDGGWLHEAEIRTTFGEEVFSNFVLLSKPKEYDSDSATQEEKLRGNTEKVKQLMKSDFIPRVVKIEDRLNNIECIAVVGNNPKYQRYVRETVALFVPLAQTINNAYVQALQKEIIRLSHA